VFLANVSLEGEEELGCAGRDYETDMLLPGNQNSYLIKRNTNGGVRFSRDPLNLTNVHSRKVCCSRNGYGEKDANRDAARWIRQ
jgi:hypothetical protein